MNCEFEDLWVCQRNVNSSRLKAARLGNISLTLSLLRNYLSIHFPVTFKHFSLWRLRGSNDENPFGVLAINVIIGGTTGGGKK